MTLILSGTDNSASAPAVTGGTAGTSTGPYFPATNQWAVATNGTQRLIIDASGNVGIGTSSPSARVDIRTAALGTALQLSDDTNYGANFIGVSGGLKLAMNGSQTFAVWQDVNPRLTMASSGYFGIQNTSPAAPLHVGALIGTGSLNGYTRFALESTDYAVATWKSPAANFSQIIFTDTTTTSLGGINYFNSTNVTPNAMAFVTAGSERARIDASGNVGIGTSSPTQTLTLASGFVQTGNGVGGGGGVWFPYSSDAAGRTWRARTDLVAYGDWGLEQSTTQAGTTFATKLLMTNDGRFYVNQTAGNGNTAQRMGVTYDGATEWAFAVKTTNATGGNPISFQNSSGTQVGVINQTNTATSYSTSSDYRLKENIAPLTGALAKVALLKPVTYKWKLDGADAEGFIAHELAEVCPAAVHGVKDATKTVEIKDEDGNVTGTEVQPVYQGIDTSFLVATLTAAIQEQQALITALTARVAELEKIPNK